MKTSDVAVKAGVNIQTVRLYERLGLIKEPNRRPSGYRDFPDSAVETIRFIKASQMAGFTLREIKQLISLRDPKRFSAKRVGDIARSKIAEIDMKIRHLQEMREILARSLETCQCEGDSHACLLVNSQNGK